MLLALFPLIETLGALAKFFNEISSSLCDSRVVDESELVSPEALKSFFDPNFDLQLDFPFSGGATTGTVRLLIRGAFSKETVEVIGSSLGWLNPRDITESGEKGGSTAELEPLRFSATL
jgi:hypothetical protein